MNGSHPWGGGGNTPGPGRKHPSIGATSVGELTLLAMVVTHGLGGKAKVSWSLKSTTSHLYQRQQHTRDNIAN